MEPKQNYLAVGAVVVALTIGLLGFVVWLSGMSEDTDTRSYQTWVLESVNGLAVGSSVKYRGVEIGKVVIIEISRQDPAKIHIVMQVDADAPITVGTVAVLQMQGITGVSYVDLRGATAGAEPLLPTGNDKIAVIPSAPSEFRQIVDTVPDMLQKFTELAEKMGQFANTENQQKVASILTHLDAFSAQAGGMDENGKTLAQNMQQAASEIRETAATINKTVTGSRGDVEKILDNSANALDRITRLTESTTNLSQQGYKDLRELQVEIKQTARELQRLSRDLKENPSRIIIPQQQGGVQAR